MTYVKHNCASLLSSYRLENKVETTLGSASSAGAAPRVRFHPRSAKAADTVLEHLGSESEEEETEGTGQLRYGRRQTL